MDIKKIFFFFFIHSLLIYSQVKLKSDREAMNMCGCLKLFNFETFQHSKDKIINLQKIYQKRWNWQYQLSMKKFISIQHLLIVGVMMKNI